MEPSTPSFPPALSHVLQIECTEAKQGAYVTQNANTRIPYFDLNREVKKHIFYVSTYMHIYMYIKYI